MNRGDYYRGDYYRGDPGFFSWVSKGIGKLAKFIPGAGALVSVGAGAVGALVEKRRRQIASGELQPNIMGRALVRAEGPVGPVPTEAEIGILAPGGGRGIMPGGSPTLPV